MIVPHRYLKPFSACTWVHTILCEYILHVNYIVKEHKTACAAISSSNFGVKVKCSLKFGYCSADSSQVTSINCSVFVSKDTDRHMDRCC